MVKKIGLYHNTTGTLKESIYELLNNKSKNDIKRLIGYNSGNLIINEFFLKNIIYTRIPINEKPEQILMICANFIRPGVIKEWGEQIIINVDFLKKNQISIILLGVGCQATFEQMNAGEYAKLLEPELVKWISELSHCCNSIGVRGEFTADVLRKIGIKNIDCVGCPSWFVNGYNQPQVIKKPWSKDLKPAVYTCWDNYSNWHQNWNHALFSEALKLKNPKFVIQSEFGFLPYKAFNENILKFLYYSNFKELLNSINLIKNTFGLEKSDIIKNSKIRHMFEMFLDIDKWSKFIKTRDFAYGMRIHGSVIAIKNGIPAIPIVPDSRILEMCELFRIPYIKVSDVASENFNLQKIYEEADFSEMNNAYPKLLQNYIDFLNKNNVEHKFVQGGNN